MVNYCIYILLTKREGRTGRISARGLDSMDRAQRGPYKKDQGPIFSQYGPEQAWLIRDLLHDWRKTQMIDCKDTINFKRAIFIYGKLNVYSRLTFPKRRKTKLEENKNNILCGVNTFRRKKK